LLFPAEINPDNRAPRHWLPALMVSLSLKRWDGPKALAISLADYA